MRRGTKHEIAGNGRAGFCEWCGEPKAWCERCSKWFCNICDGDHPPRRPAWRESSRQDAARGPRTGGGE